MKTILITGFDPFGGETVNPSWEAVKALPAQIDDIAVHKLQIPTVFGKASQTVLEYAKRIQPDCILCIGQAGGRNGITPERVAINLRDASICDNEGNRPIDTPIAENGKNAYFATVPVKKLVDALKEQQIPASLSYSAGTFVCNDTFYTLLQAFEGTDTRVGFIHVPFLPAQAKNGQPSVELSEIIRALTVCCRVSLL
ncbi:MAG: pyroglutamyl-peptidase I [Clostridia bacterium]|nr:pyroglutamyl-peptidase I [Clostridia bacterium]